MPSQDGIELPDRIIVFPDFNSDDKYRMHGHIYYAENRSMGSIWAKWDQYNLFVQLK